MEPVRQVVYVGDDVADVSQRFFQGGQRCGVRAQEIPAVQVELEAHEAQTLGDVVVQLARDSFPLVFTRADDSPAQILDGPFGRPPPAHLEQQRDDEDELNEKDGETGQDVPGESHRTRTLHIPWVTCGG